MVCPWVHGQIPLFEKLPVEIVRDVFEFAAWSDKRTATALDCVNRTLHGWMNRPIYEEVILHDPWSLVTFSEVIRQAPGIPHSSESPSPPEHTAGLHVRPLSIARDFAFFCATVKYLSVMHVHIPFHHVRDIFIVCAGVRVLEIDNPYLPFPPTTMQPSELILGSIKADIFVSEMFRNVTRLWLASASSAITRILEYPPQLEYIAIPLRVTSSGGHRRTHVGDEARLLTTIALTSVELIIINIEKGYTHLTTKLQCWVPPQPEEVWRDVLYHILDSRLLVRVPKDLAKEPELARKQGMSVWDRAIRDGMRHPSAHIVSIFLVK
jgi:hypothetical protein